MIELHSNLMGRDSGYSLMVICGGLEGVLIGGGWCQGGMVLHALTALRIIRLSDFLYKQALWMCLNMYV